MEVAKEAIEVLEVSASKKNVELILEGESCTILGVRRYVYEIIYNLCYRYSIHKQNNPAIASEVLILIFRFS